MSMFKDLLSFSDLPSLNSSPDSVLQKFKDYFNKKPDGISVNSERYFNAVIPAITERYGHPCYKVLGDFTFSQGQETSQQVLLCSNYVTNTGDEDADMSLDLNATWAEDTTWDSSVTIGMSKTAEVSIEGVFSTGISFDTSITIGKSESNSISNQHPLRFL
jgi:hypothetical protein